MGDLFGIAALWLLAFTGVFMAARKLLLKFTKNLDLLRRLHIIIGTLAGFFLVLHISFFISFPFNDGIILGYAATAVAVFVWLSGTAFLERFRDSLFFHGTMTVTAVGLILLHSAVSGANLPLMFTELLAGAVVVTMAIETSRQIAKTV